jgi:hypothetical protein
MDARWNFPVDRLAWEGDLIYGMPMDPNGLSEAVREAVLARLARAKGEAKTAAR